MGKAKDSFRYSSALREEDLKNKVARDWFGGFDTTGIIGNIDFCVAVPATELDLCAAQSVMWAEAKRGRREDIRESFVQLILTIGKERTFNRYLPPKFLGAFDAEKIAFVPYHEISDVFYKNDFNWNVTASDHDTKEFRELYALIADKINENSTMFDWSKDEKELRRFIKSNFTIGVDTISRILITKNNFMHIYRRWCDEVLPFIDAPWGVLKDKYAIYDRDFYLAEMNIDDNGTADIADDRVASDFYITFDARLRFPYTVRRKNEDELNINLTFGMKPGGIDAYSAFWRRYKRPPRKEYWNYIVERLDLLVAQDVRVYKGAFFTPARWVELSQHYLEQELGSDWQEEYYVWDCCAGTGNLLDGLSEKHRIWASTLDEQDVEAMRQRIENGYNLLPAHAFQFDFLNDPFDGGKLPADLLDVINDPEKRSRLVIYINPPYAEAGSTFAKESKVGVSNKTAVHGNYAEECGKFAKRELFVQFLMRIYKDIPGCVIGQFSKLKHLQGPYFRDFRKVFRARLSRSFVVPADTFDNVKGEFPIGFFVWRLSEPEHFIETQSDVYMPQKAAYHFTGTKYISSYEQCRPLNDWLRDSWRSATGVIGYLACNGNDFQHQNEVAILSAKGNGTSTFFKPITRANVLKSCIYFSVRHAIEADWLNDRDQFLYPNDGWSDDFGFHADCLAFALFHGQNRITSSTAVNHWIPFSEKDVDAKGLATSHFMTEFLAGKASLGADAMAMTQCELDLGVLDATRDISSTAQPKSYLECLSPAALAVFDAGLDLWRYYHSRPGASPNASFYDIRLHFQGKKLTADGREMMNHDSPDEAYMKLLAALRTAVKNLARNIAPKVYEYGFLKR